MEFLPLRFESSGICWRNFSHWMFFWVFFFLSKSFSGTSQNCAIIIFRRYLISISFKAKFVAFFGQDLKWQISNGWNLSTRAFRVQVVASETWLVKKSYEFDYRMNFLDIETLSHRSRHLDILHQGVKRYLLTRRPFFRYFHSYALNRNPQ